MAPVNVKVAANNFLDFVNASPTPFHAVKSVKEKLTAAGFKEIRVSSINVGNRRVLKAKRKKTHGPPNASQAASTI